MCKCCYNYVVDKLLGNVDVRIVVDTMSMILQCIMSNTKFKDLTDDSSIIKRAHTCNVMVIK